MKYMKRVSAELETVGGGPEEEELIVQGVKFAFRVHQVKKNSDMFVQSQNLLPFSYSNFLKAIWSNKMLCLSCSLPAALMSKQWGHSKNWEIRRIHAMSNATATNKNSFAGLQHANTGANSASEN